MTPQELTLEILAERALTRFDSKRLIDWAIAVLALDYESENLYVLAGLDFDTTEDREKYFWKSIQDLGLEVEADQEKLIEQYAFAIARRAVKKSGQR